MEPDVDNFSEDDFNDDRVKEKVSEIGTEIDRLCEKSESNEDGYVLRTIYKKANALFKKIKSIRSEGFSNGGGEYNEGNIIFKTLRRNGYIGKLSDLKLNIYNKMNGLS